MGNLCFTQDTTIYYNKTYTCYKCDDSFYFRKPRRTACRFHHYDKNDICTVCHKHKDSPGNCYHTKKIEYWGLCHC